MRTILQATVLVVTTMRKQEISLSMMSIFSAMLLTSSSVYVLGAPPQAYMMSLKLSWTVREGKVLFGKSRGIDVGTAEAY